MFNSIQIFNYATAVWTSSLQSDDGRIFAIVDGEVRQLISESPQRWGAPDDDAPSIEDFEAPTTARVAITDAIAALAEFVRNGGRIPPSKPGEPMCVLSVSTSGKDWYINANLHLPHPFGGFLSAPTPVRFAQGKGLRNTVASGRWGWNHDFVAWASTVGAGAPDWQKVLVGFLPTMEDENSVKLVPMDKLPEAPAGQRRKTKRPTA